MMTDRDKNISEMLDWCVDALDTLNELPPEIREAAGIDMVRGWKAALERAMDGGNHEQSN